MTVFLPSHPASQDASRESGKAGKAHKTAKEHRERPRKDSEGKGPAKEPEREPARGAKDTARKLGEGRPPKEEKAPPPKAAFKEPKMALKETKLESLSPKGGPPQPPPPKSSNKRPAAADSPKPSAKKQKKSSSKGSRGAPGTSPRTSSSFSDKKPVKDKGSTKGEKVKAESEPREVKKPPEVEESNSEDEASFKTEVRHLSPPRQPHHPRPCHLSALSPWKPCWPRGQAGRPGFGPRAPAGSLQLAAGSGSLAVGPGGPGSGGCEEPEPRETRPRQSVTAWHPASQDFSWGASCKGERLGGCPGAGQLHLMAAPSLATTGPVHQGTCSPVLGHQQDARAPQGCGTVTDIPRPRGLGEVGEVRQSSRARPLASLTTSGRRTLEAACGATSGKP